MVNYEWYLTKATENKFTILSEKEWTELYNQIRLNKIYFARMEQIDNVRIDNLLLKIGVFKNERPV